MLQSPLLMTRNPFRHKWPYGLKTSFHGSNLIRRAALSHAAETKTPNHEAMPGKSIDFDVVREIALALPGVEESILHGAPALKVAGRMLTCPALHKSAEPNSLMVRIGLEERTALLVEDPSRYYITDHYAQYPSVLVRLSRMDRQSLGVLLQRSWQFVTSKAKNRGGRHVNPMPRKNA
jgi:hypothetical protein